jgi:hypothetical protein
MKETSCSKGIRVLIYACITSVTYIFYAYFLDFVYNTSGVESLAYGTPTVIF